jgi:hypothetical protein
VSWVGKWKNQFGSIVTVTSDADGCIEGTFVTALKDSAFYGEIVAIKGVHRGNCISFTSVGGSASGDHVVSYTGLLRDGKMETAWFMVSDQAISAAKEGEAAVLQQLNWWRAVSTNFDTFERG